MTTKRVLATKQVQVLATKQVMATQRGRAVRRRSHVRGVHQWDTPDLESIEVPEGSEPQDGIDEDERSNAEAAIRTAFENEGLDPDGENDTLAQHVGYEADAATAEILANLDPDGRVVITGASG